ncbi:hypothetical protein [Xanthomonas phage BUDD]|nr:hypothetical protein [Xanthomonas phage BUDD]
MPMYDFKCKTCDHVQTEIMSISRMESGEEAVCKECGGVSAKTFTKTSWAAISPEALGRNKAPEDFRNFLSQVKKAHPGSTIKDR